MSGAGAQKPGSVSNRVIARAFPDVGCPMLAAGPVRIAAFAPNQVERPSGKPVVPAPPDAPGPANAPKYEATVLIRSN